MPPHSKSIFEEGAVFKSFKLVREGVFQEAEVTEVLFQPSQHPGSSGTRNLADNLSDLRAQASLTLLYLVPTQVILCDYKQTHLSSSK